MSSECRHLRVRPYHGPYISGRCPDCGAYIRGIWNKTTGYRRLEVVPENRVYRAIAWVKAIGKRTGQEIAGLLYWDGFFQEERIQVGMTLYDASDFTIIERKPIEGNPENPWIGKLPVRYPE